MLIKKNKTIDNQLLKKFPLGLNGQIQTNIDVSNKQLYLSFFLEDKYISRITKVCTNIKNIKPIIPNSDKNCI